MIFFIGIICLFYGSTAFAQAWPNLALVSVSHYSLSLVIYYTLHRATKSSELVVTILIIALMSDRWHTRFLIISLANQILVLFVRHGSCSLYITVICQNDSTVFFD